MIRPNEDGTSGYWARLSLENRSCQGRLLLRGVSVASALRSPCFRNGSKRIPLIQPPQQEPSLPLPQGNKKDQTLRSTVLLIGAAATALAIASCKKNDEETNAPSAVTNAEVNATPSANPTATVLSTTDITKAPNFVTQVAASDMFEIQSSKVALQRSSDPDVKRFARMMIDAHGRTTAKLKGLIAGQDNLAPPTSLPSDLQTKLDKLGSLSPADFDKAYLDDQVDGHQSALNVMQRYAKDGDLEPLKQFAADTAPTVQQHLDRAKALRDGLNKGSGNVAANRESDQ